MELHGCHCSALSLVAVMAQGVKQMPTAARRPEDQHAELQKHPQPDIFASEMPSHCTCSSALSTAIHGCYVLQHGDMRADVLLHTFCSGDTQQRVLGELESQYLAGVRRGNKQTVGLGIL